MNVRKLLALGAVVCLLATGARAEEKPDYAKLIVGKWEITKADEGTIPKGAIVEFSKDGKFKATEKTGDKDMVFEGTYKVEGDKFEVTIKIGDDSHSNTITIVKMSATEMSTKDKDGKAVEAKKVK